MVSPFSESPYWQAFWRNTTRDQMVTMYSFAPFLQETGTLLFGARRLWHPWSVKRIEELETISGRLKDRARVLRQRGLTWACNDSAFGKDPAHVMSMTVHYRDYGSRDNTLQVPCVEATPYMASAAVQLLFMLLQQFEKIVEEKHWYEERHWVKDISEVIETLMESPYTGSMPKMTDVMMRAVMSHAVLTECEGLAYTQATIENAYNRKNKTAKRKRSDLSDEKLHALADDIGVEFDVLKGVFETEYSSWGKVADAYRKRAVVERESFVSTLDVDDKIIDAITAVWDPGFAYINSTPDYMSEREVGGAEKIIQTFISMFLSSLKGNDLTTRGGASQKLLKAPV